MAEEKEIEVEFGDPNYEIVDEDRVVRKADAPEIPEDQVMSSENALLEHIVTYVQARIKSQFDFMEIWIPNDEIEPNCSILVTPNWDICENLLVIAQNAVGSQLGIWSRSLCLESGLKAGSMLPYISSAVEEGFGVMILRPNTNYKLMEEKEGDEGEETPTGRMQKVPIDGSSSPEEHILYVWDNIIPDSQARKICLVGYGNGAILCKVLHSLIIDSTRLN